jgi:hypothetical protein
MRKYYILIILIFITACATVPDVKLVEGMPNTITIVNENGTNETVYDMSGNWISERREKIQIKQDGLNVEGYWKENRFIEECKAGSKWFHGKLKGSRVTGQRYLCYPEGKVDFLSIRISKEGNIFDIDHIIDGVPGTSSWKRLK